jgi:putative ABC transport system ATP-binding protein
MELAVMSIETTANVDIGLDRSDSSKIKAVTRGGAEDAASGIRIDSHPESALGGNAIMEVRDLTRQVNGRTVVDGIAVAIQQGEIIAIVGPSGAGKSSLLRLLNRIDEPSGGTVLIGQRDYREMEPRQLRRRVGMVMQTSFLFPGTVTSNLLFGPAQLGKVLRADQIAALLQSIGLPDYQDRDVSTLSGGEAQRVSFARTLANDPEVLLLDEPTSALDEQSVRTIEELILAINNTRKMTCVIVTHSDQQALRIAPRTMIMESGRLVAVGASKDILSGR